MAYTMIVVGTDGSESALLAVTRAAEMAAEAKALLVVVCAYSPMSTRERAVPTATIGDTRFYEVIGTAAAEEALDAATLAAKEAGAEGIAGELIEGDAAEALLDVAKKRSADLIVVGNRGVNTLTGRLLGSVVRVVAQQTTCDMLMVHNVEGGKH